MQECILFPNGTWLSIMTSHKRENDKDVSLIEPKLCVPVCHGSRLVAYIPVTNAELFINLLNNRNVFKTHPASAYFEGRRCRLVGPVHGLLGGSPVVTMQHEDCVTTELWNEQQRELQRDENDSNRLGEVLLILKGPLQVQDVLVFVREDGKSDSDGFYVPVFESSKVIGKSSPRQVSQAKQENDNANRERPYGERIHYLNLGATAPFLMMRYDQDVTL